MRRSIDIHFRWAMDRIAPIPEATTASRCSGNCFWSDVFCHRIAHGGCRSGAEMNLLSQIAAAADSVTKKAPRSGHEKRLQNLLLGGKAQSAKALAKYRSVMQAKGWMKQTQIENALGYASTVSTCYLRKLHNGGFIERRNFGGAKEFKRKEGYEWKWIDGK